MQRIPLVQIGVGGVGRALLDLVLDNQDHWATRDGFTFHYVALADSRSLLAGDDLGPGVLRAALGQKAAGEPLGPGTGDWLGALPTTPALVVDVSASDATAPALVQAIERGHRVVLANKKPLTTTRTLFYGLTEGRHTRFEATVGAGLPVITTLESILDTGDEVQEIAGCFSGTLGYVFTELERGTPFSEAVLTARTRGWTEPDPRDDLGGVDVARKALILARTLGYQLMLDDLPIEPLFSPDQAQLSLDAFLAVLPTLDESWAARMQTAQAEGNTLRYVATVGRSGTAVGVRSVPQRSALGTLQGPDNFVQFTTTRYAEQPIVVRGPGAGSERTAAAVLNDLLILARQMRS